MPDAIFDAVDELTRRVEAGTATPEERELLQGVDDADRALGVGDYYDEAEWCPRCHMRSHDAAGNLLHGHDAQGGCSPLDARNGQGFYDHPDLPGNDR